MVHAEKYRKTQHLCAETAVVQVEIVPEANLVRGTTPISSNGSTSYPYI